MDVSNKAQPAPPTNSASMDHTEETPAEVDEPPDQFDWSPTKLNFNHIKWQPRNARRESLLTRQLHSETEHTDDDSHMSSPPRTLSTQSTWSNPSTTSMAELTEDDGHSVASPGMSPKLLPTQHHNTLLVPVEPLESKVKIVGHDDVVNAGEKETTSEKSVEANLGRKRCISFACRPKPEQKPAEPPKAEVAPASPPKRKCMLKFACPTRASSESKPSEKVQTKRAASPPPPTRRSSVLAKHRGSDATITHTSPKAVRKSSSTSVASTQAASSTPVPIPSNKYADDSDEDGGKEAMRFHEFGTSAEEPEEWVQESTCHRSRLTVDDTLKKETVIRKACEEVEEEVLEEEEAEEDAEEELEEEGIAELDVNGQEMERDDDYESDEGFHSDDEGGFASSDDEEDDESDYEWWKPAASTAATSVEQLDRLAIINSEQPVSGTSAGSASSVQRSPRSSRATFRKAAARRNKTPAMRINRPASPGLPDSTDFVCGTLDEDRPLEQAYINRRKSKEAAKHKVKPQDIDPSFPTSDPEMDEEDDDDVDEVPDSEEDEFMHGDLEELHATPRRSPPLRTRGRSSAHKSPPPPTKRMMSPPPPRRSIARSPPPPTRRSIARSPPPRKLFGHSPSRRSPAPGKRMTSPPNSPTEGAVPMSTAPRGLGGLAGRPQPTHTSSLPRGGPITLSKLATIRGSANEDSDAGAATAIPKRSAIDIVKGVQWKRQRRKEKLYQKACAKAAAKDKNHKVKPGKGAERMREVGLQLQQYHGKAEHILSL